MLEKGYNEFKLHYNKQSVEEILIQRAVKTTTEIVYDKRFSEDFDKASEDFLIFARGKLDLEESK